MHHQNHTGQSLRAHFQRDVRIPIEAPQPIVDGGEKEVHFGGQKGASATVTLWPLVGMQAGRAGG
jgi:hypothetical protein